MARQTTAKTEENRHRIVDAASRMFRERGFDGVGVSDLMASAGFTHGGFYNHFASKSELFAEAAGAALRRTIERSTDIPIDAFVKSYVSREHRDEARAGCALAALGADAARQDMRAQTVFADGIEAMVTALADDIGSPNGMSENEVRREAIALLAQSVGALVLSRACPDTSALSDEILAASRDGLLAAASARRGSAPDREP